ncbi:MAG TPA: hypothetical protein VMR16_02110 [Candidatus Saccharimonadales bacterium]|nr:hypothetical protein [Candidatus Saccharimonadales bacterium]
MDQVTLEKTGQPHLRELPVFTIGDEYERQAEARIVDLEEYRRRCVGHEAIKISAEELGYNDVLTYLYRYLENNGTDIMPDFVADMGERLINSNHFENHVYFKPIGNDFISSKDKVSLTGMNSRSVRLLKEESAKNPKNSKLKIEYERAKLEFREVGIISEWFNDANEGAFLVFESPPLTEGEDYAVTRIYQRVGDILEGCFISLNNSSLTQFNKLRDEFGSANADCGSVLEILGSPYEINKPQFKNTSDFVDYYVGTYDRILSLRNQKNYSFGFETPDGSQNQNSAEIVKAQTGLLTVFTETVRMLAESKGKVTPELIHICEDFEVRGAHEGRSISSGMAREILEAVALGVEGSFVKIDQEVLRALESSNCGYKASYDTAVYSSNRASAAGETYGGLCPTFDISFEQTDGRPGFEHSALLQAFGVHDRLGNFGKPKVDVCRITNCPSRGESRFFPKKTLVGGCEICVHCHKLFEKGKSPDRIYKEEKDKQEEDEKKNMELVARQIEIQQADELEKVRKRKQQREHEKQRFYVKTDEKVKKAA